MAERLFGMETEYGFAVLHAVANRVRRARDWSAQFFDAAIERLPHLKAADGGGIFLPSGARFYVDCGHPEMTTPECANPWDVVRYMLAGERTLLEVAAEFKRSDASIRDVLLFKTNTGPGATWGCHTSFLHQSNPAIFPAQIIPHLVSRIIYSGAGGIQTGPDGVHFTLSPRVAFLDREISDNSTDSRGIFHSKDETLSSDGFHRLHIICGESLCSETALWLNMGVTALIVAMIEMGLRPGDDVQLPDPLGTMRRFASDPTCTAAVTASKRRSLTAIGIQRHYLELAQSHLGHRLMPPWAGVVCAQWRDILDRLEQSAPASVATTLDWAIKFCLFSEWLARRGIAWAKAEKNLMLPLFDDDDPEKPPFYLPHEFHEAHQELCEIDTRFSRLGQAGIFAALQDAGALAQRVPGADNIEHALSNPPAIGRARLRGECVQRYAHNEDRYAAAWTGVFDKKGNQFMDLSHPFTESASWRPLPPGVRGVFDPSTEHIHRMLNMAEEFLDAGKYEKASEFLRDLAPELPRLGAALRCEYLRILAWVQGRRGFLDSINALDELARFRPMSFRLANDYTCAYRYQGLAPPTAIEASIAKGREFMDEPSGDHAPTVPFLDHCGYILLRNGRPEEARRVLEQACGDQWDHLTNDAAKARALCDFADACRSLGRHEEARRALNEAARLERNRNAEGDLANFNLTYQAKLESDSANALDLLTQAKRIQTRNSDLMGLTRSLVLEARLLDKPSLAAARKGRIVDLRGKRPALGQCRLLAKILNHWETWTAGGPDPDSGADAFWWL